MHSMERDVYKLEFDRASYIANGKRVFLICGEIIHSFAVSSAL